MSRARELAGPCAASTYYDRSTYDDTYHDCCMFILEMRKGSKQADDLGSAAHAKGMYLRGECRSLPIVTRYRTDVQRLMARKE
eukprot:scaffold4493_cov205-Skeletonema_dohrnii-CCMP3373.AAC.3